MNRVFVFNNDMLFDSKKSVFLHGIILIFLPFILQKCVHGIIASTATSLKMFGKLKFKGISCKLVIHSNLKIEILR